MTKIPVKISKLVNFLESKNDISEEGLSNAIKKLYLSISDVGSYVHFNHPVNESYGRSVIYESSKVEIVLMSWNKEDYTSIHDHGYAQLGAVYAFGNIQNRYYKIENNTLKKLNETVLKKGEIAIIDNSSIHQMGNPYDEPVLSLHVYYTNKNVESVTGESRNFDLYSDTVYRANGGAFLDILQKDIVAKTKCPKFNSEVYEDYLKIMQQYMNKRKFIDVVGSLSSFAYAV